MVRLFIPVFPPTLPSMAGLCLLLNYISSRKFA